MKMIMVSAYKSPKKQELFLFIPKETELDDLPDELLVMFGEPSHVLDFELTPDRKMARGEAAAVYEAMVTKGYYMQMPPAEFEKMGDMTPPPERLDNIF